MHMAKKKGKRAQNVQRQARKPDMTLEFEITPEGIMVDGKPISIRPMSRSEFDKVRTMPFPHPFSGAFPFPPSAEIIRLSDAGAHPESILPFALSVFERLVEFARMAALVPDEVIAAMWKDQEDSERMIGEGIPADVVEVNRRLLDRFCQLRDYYREVKPAIEAARDAMEKGGK
jgi:hypothetical protein